MQHMEFMPGSPCIICRQKNTGHRYEKLQRMYELCRHNGISDSEITREDRALLTWHFHSRCRYGLPCQNLKAQDVKCKDFAREMTGDIIKTAIEGGKKYHELLQLCRGDFPEIYRKLEKINARHKNK